MGISHSHSVKCTSGLTAKQKTLVQESWKELTNSSGSNGVIFMISFFRKFPKYQEEFTPFKSVPLNELESSIRFHAHCESIVSTLTSAINTLDDEELMNEILITTGVRHGRRGQTDQAFTDLKSVILDVLKTKLGNNFIPETFEAWEKTLDVIFSRIIEGIRNKKR